MVRDITNINYTVHAGKRTEFCVNNTLAYYLSLRRLRAKSVDRTMKQTPATIGLDENINAFSDTKKETTRVHQYLH